MRTADHGGRRRAPGIRASRLRAPTAVLALYALVLQAVLGSIAALPVVGVDPFGVHCLQGAAPGDEAGTTGSRDGPAPHAHPACCTAAHHADGALLPPTPAAVQVAWPDRPALRAARPAESPRAARAPPNVLAEARAPPVV